MKKLIKLSETRYIIVDDSEIKEGDYYYLKSVATKNMILKSSEFKTSSNCKKITHSTQSLSDKPHYAAYDIITLQEVEELFNCNNTMELARESAIDNNYDVDNDTYKHGFVEGFNAHKELMKDKLFTVEDVMKFYKHVKTHTVKEAMDLILQKTEWLVEFDKQGKLKLI